jgi:hypothetical protein
MHGFRFPGYFSDRFKDANMVMIAVPATVVPGLRLALLSDKTKLGYELLAGTPTPTYTPTASSEPVNPPTPFIAEGIATAQTVPLRISADDYPFERPLPTEGSRYFSLVIVHKLETSQGQPLTEGSEAFSTCISGADVTYLDEDNVKMDEFVADSLGSLVVQIPETDLEGALAGLAQKASVYFINNPQCEPDDQTAKQ